LEGREEEAPDAVRLTTLHASKGLEYPHVFLIGCEEGILPHQQSIDGGMVEEERRLMYVGITRAQRSLTISYCGKRKRAGEWQITEPSRFLLELPPEEIRISGRLAGKKNVVVSKEEGKAKLANLLAGLGNKFRSPPGKAGRLRPVTNQRLLAVLSLSPALAAGTKVHVARCVEGASLALVSALLQSFPKQTLPV
jgi:hypothetical protein